MRSHTVVRVLQLSTCPGKMKRNLHQYGAAAVCRS
jgi:hypothetical protein